jgi:hypothetical protein
VQRGFVIAFSPETDIDQGLVTGRIEHVASGRAMQFTSVDELLAFVKRVLTSDLAKDEREGEDGPG